MKIYYIKYLINFSMGPNYMKNYLINLQNFLNPGLIEQDDVILSDTLLDNN